MATGGTESDFAQFVDDQSLTFAQINDASGEVFNRFGITVQHAVVVIASDSDVTTMLGAVDEEALEAILVELGT